MLSSYVWVTTSFPGFHRWKDAPEECKYLRDWHRHIFHVKLYKKVSHDNRDIEFIKLKNKVTLYLNETYAHAKFDNSCEQIAKNLLDNFDAECVEVSEDGENGALVCKTTALSAALSAPIGTPSPESLPEAPKTSQKTAPEPPANPRTPSPALTPEVCPQPQEDGSGAVLGSPPEGPVSLQVRTRCFLGTEAEGPRRGTKTLFIPGSVSPERIEKATEGLSLGSGKFGFSSIYYGAGNDFPLREDTLSYIPSCFPLNRLTIEIPSWDWIRDHSLGDKFGKPHLTVVSRTLEDLALREEFITYVKVIHCLPDKTYWLGKIYWLGRTAPYVHATSLTDPLFDKDVYLE